MLTTEHFADERSTNTEKMGVYTQYFTYEINNGSEFIMKAVILQKYVILIFRYYDGYQHFL